MTIQYRLFGRVQLIQLATSKRVLRTVVVKRPMHIPTICQDIFSGLRFVVVVVESWPKGTDGVPTSALGISWYECPVPTKSWSSNAVIVCWCN